MTKAKGAGIPAVRWPKRTFDTVRDWIGLIGLSWLLTTTYGQNEKLAILIEQQRGLPDSMKLVLAKQRQQGWKIDRLERNDDVTQRSVEQMEHAIWPTDFRRWTTNYDKRRRELYEPNREQ